MTYCTLAQLETTYGTALLIELSFRGDTMPVTPDADLFTRAIADADAMIDGYLFGRYALPMATPPALVTDLSQRIAIYKAHARVADDKIRKDYEDALKTLGQIASGVIRLQVAGVEPASSGGSEVTTNTPNRELTGETMKGYI